LFQPTTEAAWPELDKAHPPSLLDDLYRRLDDWSPSLSEASRPNVTEVESHARAYRKYLDAYGAAKGVVPVGLAREAQQRLVLWEWGAKVVKLLREPDDHRVEQVSAMVDLAQDRSLARFEATARRLVQVLCGDLLKPEPLDETVLVIGDQQAAAEPFPRQQVVIRWKDQTMVALDKSGFDEFTLPRDRVENFLLPMGTTRDLPEDPKIAPLRGTEYSQAVRAFNLERARIQHWCEPELTRLRDTCETNKAALARGRPGSGGLTLIARVDALLRIARRHPNLFVASTP
jgi:hypothetical protein